MGRRRFIPPRSALILTLLAAGLSACEFEPRDIGSLQGTGRVCFVTLGEFPRAQQRSLVKHYEEKYGLRVEVLGRLPLDARSLDDDRQQLVAEEAIRILKQGYPELAQDPEALLIGLTEQDMYIRGKTSWYFAFSYREDGRFAVVSSARMAIGLTEDQKDAFQSRFRKMVTKNIGVLYYRLPQSLHPRSVMYKHVGGIQELDFMGEDF